MKQLKRLRSLIWDCKHLIGGDGDGDPVGDGDGGPVGDGDGGSAVILIQHPGDYWDIGESEVMMIVTKLSFCAAQTLEKLWKPTLEIYGLEVFFYHPFLSSIFFLSSTL